MKLRQAVPVIGSLYRDTTSDKREYVGTCFSIIDATVFITASHFVASGDVASLWVNHFGAGGQDSFTRAREVHMIDEAISQSSQPTHPRRSGLVLLVKFSTRRILVQRSTRSAILIYSPEI